MKAFYHPRNAWMHIIDGSTFFIGTSLCSFTVIIPAYVKGLTSSPFLLVLLPFLMEVGMYGMQPLTTWLFRKQDSAHTIRVYFWTEFIHRLSFVAIGLSIFIFGHHQGLALISFFFFWTASNVSWGLAIPHWVDILTITIPDRIRADFLGKRELISRLIGVAASFFVPLILAGSAYPVNYGWLFLVAGILFSLGAFSFRAFVPLHHFVPEAEPAPTRFVEYMKQGFLQIFKHKELLPFLVVIWGMSISRLSYAYFTPYILESVLIRYSADQQDIYLSVLNTSLLVFTALASFVSGKLIHHLGHKTALLGGGLALIVANVLLLVFPVFPAALAANFFLALFMGNSYMVSLNVIMDYSHVNVRSRILAFNNLINIGFIFVFGLVGSLVASHWGYAGALWVTVGVMALILAGVLLRFPSDLRPVFNE